MYVSLTDWPLAIDTTPALPCAIPPYRCQCQTGYVCPPCAEERREAAIRAAATRNAKRRAKTPAPTRKHGVGDRPRAGQGWLPTPDEIAAYQAGMSIYALQRRTGKSRHTVRQGLKRVGAWELRLGKNLPGRERRQS